MRQVSFAQKPKHLQPEGQEMENAVPSSHHFETKVDHRFQYDHQNPELSFLSQEYHGSNVRLARGIRKVLLRLRPTKTPMPHEPHP